MAKKKNKSFLGKFGNLFVLAFALLVGITMVFPAVCLSVENAEPIYRMGYEVAFGKELVGGSIGGVGGKTVLYFSILATLAYLLPFVVALVMALFVKNRTISGLISLAVFVFAAVIMFVMPSVTGASVTLEAFGHATTTTQTFAEAGYGLGYGSIIGGILAIFGALTSAAYGFVK